MPSQIAASKEGLPAEVAMEFPLAIMFHHVHPEEVVIEELFPANGATLSLLLIVNPADVIYHEGVPSEHAIAVSALVAGIVKLDEVLLPLVGGSERLVAKVALVLFSVVVFRLVAR